MSEPLTKRQQEVYDLICETLEETGVFPTYEEIRNALGLRAIGAVTDHLKVLERKGWLRHVGKAGAARSWICTNADAMAADPPPTAPSVTLPLYGNIAAGGPIFAANEVEEYVAVPIDLADPNADCFILRVTGNSMTGDAIREGDLAIIRKQDTARYKEIVAVQIDGEATLKHYVRNGSRVELHASNPDYAPILVESENACILGKLIGLLRFYG